MNPNSATILAIGLVAAATVISFAPGWTWQGKAELRFEQSEKRLEQAEKLQAQMAKHLEQNEKALKDIQEKFLPLQNVPGKYRLLHEKKREKSASGNTILGYALFEELATGDIYQFDENFQKFIKLHDHKKDKKE